jgi:hypothetical protein
VTFVAVDMGQWVKAMNIVDLKGIRSTSDRYPVKD